MARVVAHPKELANYAVHDLHLCLAIFDIFSSDLMVIFEAKNWWFVLMFLLFQEVSNSSSIRKGSDSTLKKNTE